MEISFKNLFNLIMLLKISKNLFWGNIISKPSVIGTLRYQQINFFMTSPLSQLLY